MTTNENYLILLMEECQEVAQRASKALRFGLDEVQEGQHETNAERLVNEIMDLDTVLELLVEKGLLVFPKEFDRDIYMKLKKAKIQKYLEYSISRDIINDGETR